MSETPVKLRSTEAPHALRYAFHTLNQEEAKMATETILLKAVDYTLQLLRIRESRSKQEQEFKRAFIEAFREALLLTRAYLADRRDRIIDRNREKELELSQAWNRVGLCGRDIEPMGDFYVVYFGKCGMRDILYCSCQEKS